MGFNLSNIVLLLVITDIGWSRDVWRDISRWGHLIAILKDLRYLKLQSLGAWCSEGF
jgi:hypothetical protein